ncbi:MAG TPA: hypothetical protein VFE59_06120 [Trebonia sp.]|nr:hypothetical protein [Trebonia sp.]
MSFTDHVVLWLHVVAAIFTIGPGTAAIMSTSRYIRKRNTVVVGYLYRITRIYVLASLLTLILGLIITQLLHLFGKPWISTSITLYVVAFVLLVLIMRDQPATIAAGDLKTAAIERGRIASLSGVVRLIWLAVIVLMVWNGR